MRNSLLERLALTSLALAFSACQSATTGDSAATADSTKVHVAVPGEHPRHGQASLWESVMEIEFVDGGKAEGHQLRVTYPNYNSFNLMAEDMPVLVELNPDGKTLRLQSKTNVKSPQTWVLSTEIPIEPAPVFKVAWDEDLDICRVQTAAEASQPVAKGVGWEELRATFWNLLKCPRLTIGWDANGLVIGSGGPDCICEVGSVAG